MLFLIRKSEMDHKSGGSYEKQMVVLGIHRDQAGTIWFGTSNGGPDKQWGI